jgi:riboflavin kinase/FMN adenylyltransferase
MNIFRHISEVTTVKNSNVTIGTFDGVHLGHHKIFESLLRKSEESGGRNFLVTFEPHPRTVVNKNFNLGLLTTLDEKLKILDKCGIENVLVIEFTPEFSQINYEAFIEKYLVYGIGVKNIILGHDHKFGRNRSGDQECLLKYGKKANFGVTVIPPFSIEKVTISSTKIRNALYDGDVVKANKFLGRSYTISGSVIEGSKRGRLVGFPTANIKLDNRNKVIPKNGVYLVECEIENTIYYGLMNIGRRPTFDNTNLIHLEVHILDFQKEIYNQFIRVNFLKRIREERKFGSAEELKNQILLDKESALNFITKITN